jgi:hypothetical protein
MPNPFAVNVGNALEVLRTAWDVEYPDIGTIDGGWYACHGDDGDIISADTPDELNAKIRAHWEARQFIAAESMSREYLFRALPPCSLPGNTRAPRRSELRNGTPVVPAPSGLPQAWRACMRLLTCNARDERRRK